MNIREHMHDLKNARNIYIVPTGWGHFQLAWLATSKRSSYYADLGQSSRISRNSGKTQWIFRRKITSVFAKIRKIIIFTELLRICMKNCKCWVWSCAEVCIILSCRSKKLLQCEPLFEKSTSIQPRTDPRQSGQSPAYPRPLEAK